MAPESLPVSAAVWAGPSVGCILSGLDFFGMGVDLFFDMWKVLDACLVLCGTMDSRAKLLKLSFRANKTRLITRQHQTIMEQSDRIKK